MDNKRKIGIAKRQAKLFGISYALYCHYKATGLKRCQICKKWQKISHFPKDRSRPDRHNSKCRACTKVKNPRKPVMPEDAKDALRERNRKNKWSLGRTLSDSHKEKLRQKCIERKACVGSNSPNWKGGVTPQNQTLRNNSDYKQWRKAVFERDNYICQKCGYGKGGIIEAHHIKSWENHPGLRYETTNGLTVCRDCHAKIHHKPDSYRNRRKAKRRITP